MTPRFLEACQSLQPAEKATWDLLLRELPDAETLSPEVLNSAMDQTLDQLWSLLRDGPVEAGLQQATSAPPPLPADNECALTTHLPYFNAGERALELVAGEVLETDPPKTRRSDLRDCDELCAAFNVLVQCQLEAICRRCGRAAECRYGDLRAVARLPSRHPFELSPEAGDGRASQPAAQPRRGRKSRAHRAEEFEARNY